jgi:hypothetical protein
LRVRASIQLGSTRVPARAFLITTGLIFIGGLLVVAGAELAKTAKLIGALVLLALVVFELRCWCRSTSEVARILLRHVRRPRRIRPEGRIVTLAVEAATAPLARRPRWQE